MAKKTKVTDRNGDERIIKRSKLRIVTITLVVLILLTLIGVGIYFIVKAVNKNEVSDDNWEVASVETVREDILDGDHSQVGVFFYKDDSAVTNFMLRDNTIYDNGVQGAGALSEVMANTKDQITWYGVEIPEVNELIEELLTVKDEDSEEYKFYDDFEYLGAGTSLRNDMWIINSLSGTDNDSDESFTVEDKAYGSFSLSVEQKPIDNEDEDDLRDVYFTDSTTTGGGDTTTESASAPTTRTAGTKYTVNEGTTMLFNGSQLTSVVNSWGTVEVSEDETVDDSADVRDQYHDDYVTFLTELTEHNRDYFN